MSNVTPTSEDYSPAIFNQICKVDENGFEFWSARDLQSLFGYKEWRVFEGCISRAAKTFKGVPKNHFRWVEKDYKLSRHACQLTASVADSRKIGVMNAREYFQGLEEPDAIPDKPKDLDHIYSLISDVTLKNQELESKLKILETTVKKTPSTRLKVSRDADTKIKIFEDLQAACKGQPRTTFDLCIHPLFRRKDVLALYGVKKALYVKKNGMINMFIDAAKNGYGRFDRADNVFIPYIEVTVF